MTSPNAPGRPSWPAGPGSPRNAMNPARHHRRVRAASMTASSTRSQSAPRSLSPRRDEPATTGPTAARDFDGALGERPGEVAPAPVSASDRWLARLRQSAGGVLADRHSCLGRRGRAWLELVQGSASFGPGMRIRHLATSPKPSDAASAVHATTRRWRADKLLEVAMPFLPAQQPLLTCSTTAISGGTASDGRTQDRVWRRSSRTDSIMLDLHQQPAAARGTACAAPGGDGHIRHPSPDADLRARPARPARHLREEAWR